MGVVYIGIDPGATGALAWIADSAVGVVDWPGDERALKMAMQNFVESVACFEPLRCRALIEHQQAMGQGFGAAMLKLGMNYGMWLSALAWAGIPTRTVAPAKWKKACGLLRKDKKASLTEARRRFPSAPLSLAKHDGRAEAILLADYAREIWGATGARIDLLGAA